MHTTPRPQLINSRPSAASPAAANGLSRRQPRNIDGIIGGPAPTADHAPQPQAKPHLQTHPMLRRQYDGDIRPAHPTPVRRVQTSPQPQTQPRRPHQVPQPATRHKATTRPAFAAAMPPVATGLGRDTPLERMASRLEAMHLSKLALLGLAMTALLIGLSLFSLQLGELVLAVYAIIAIWKRLTSRLSFALALATFGGIIVTQLLSPDSGIADNLAVYAFLLLCIGTISLAREVRQGSGKPARA